MRPRLESRPRAIGPIDTENVGRGNVTKDPLRKPSGESSHIFSGYGLGKEYLAEAVIQNHSAAFRSTKKYDGYSTTNRGDKSTSVPPDCFQGE